LEIAVNFSLTWFSKGEKTHLWRRREKRSGADEKQQKDFGPHLG